jgi:5-methylcytosine-specific restriction endonuclease McrA
MKKYHIQPGEKINRLTAIKLDHIGNHNRSYFLFQCECGVKKVILGSLVRSGNTKSCGCLSQELKKGKRISDNHSEITAIILGYKRHAEDRGFLWLLSRQFVKNIINKNCFYCGSFPSNTKKTKNSIGDGLKYSGIDRVDSKKNYTEDNVVPCCSVCNYAKSNMSLEQFRLWSIRLGKKAFASQWGRG